MSTQQQTQTNSSIDSRDNLDRSPASASPFARPNENSTTNVRGREYDQGASDPRDLSTESSPKRGEQSGRPLGSQIAKGDCDSKRWERLRKRDEELLLWDEDRDGTELGNDDGDYSAYRHEGAGVETNSDDRIRDMSLLGTCDALASHFEADLRTKRRARELVAELDKDTTGKRAYEATVTGALVVAHDEQIADRIRRIEAHDDEIQQIQEALERATSPAERFRVLNNLSHVTDDETLSRLVGGRLATRESVADVENSHGFAVKTVVENTRWSA